MPRSFPFAVFFLLLLSFGFFSCEKDEDQQVFSNPSMPMNSDQVIVPGPIVIPPSPGSGNISGSYDRETKIFSYTITWSGLSANPTAIHLHGLGGTGYLALPAPLGPFTNGIIQSFTSGLQAATSGSFSGSLYIDGTVIKEEYLLAGQFYFDIHTGAVPFSTTGEIRGQVVF